MSTSATSATTPSPAEGANKRPGANALSGPWRLHPRVALRPEPFGALAYHYGNRRLNFLRSPDLVAVVKCLGDHPTASDAFDACAIEPNRRPGFHKALAALAASDFLEPVTA